MQIKEIDIKLIETNKGQIDGLPKNPRQIKDARYKAILQSIIDDPEMLELREVIVYPLNGKFVAIAGNMRYMACKELKHKKMFCKVLSDETPVEKLRAYAIKDNVSFGENDYDLLANEWDASELLQFGFEMPVDWANADGLGTDFTLPSGDKSPFQQITFTLADKQAELIQNAIKDVKQTEEYKYCETMGNENSNGNAIYLIVSQWARQRK